MPNKKRWVAVIYYRSTRGVVPVHNPVEELDELKEIVEAGPDWHAIDRIEIRLAERGRHTYSCASQGIDEYPSQT